MLRRTELAAFVILILCIYFVHEYSPFLYHGGMFLISIVAAILVACVSHPSSFLGRLLSWKPLRWIGTRSYGIYLWHYPVIVLSTPVQEIGNPVYWHNVIRIAVTLILAEFSHRFIEKPIREDGFQVFFRRVFLKRIVKWKTSSPISKMSMGLLFVAFIIFLAGFSGVTVKNKQTHLINDRSSQEAPTSSHQPPVEKGETDAKQDQKETEEQANSSGQQTENREQQTTEQEQKQKQKESSKYVLAIGDSILLDIESNLRRRFPHITVDGKEGRQVSETSQLTSKYASFNQPNNSVIIELGTNGYFTNKQMDALLDSFSKARIYLVNTRVPRQWERKVNESLRRQANSRQNVKLVDWHSEALQHPEYFTPDGVHLVPKGSEALTALIVQAMK